ncbi:unnamed protein product [Pleuronectes platessa]|uniref:Uncharacterized protein n=1 Tax=Pleuronectes platessa TaxID=8262 RepID=A0A9N7YFT6_PLEPL|nr:unnamed protein product [Pleuronectes platessa]
MESYNNTVLNETEKGSRPLRASSPVLSTLNPLPADYTPFSLNPYTPFRLSPVRYTSASARVHYTIFSTKTTAFLTASTSCNHCVRLRLGSDPRPVVLGQVPHQWRESPALKVAEADINPFSVNTDAPPTLINLVLTTLAGIFAHSIVTCLLGPPHSVLYHMRLRRTWLAADGVLCADSCAGVDGRDVSAPGAPSESSAGGLYKDIQHTWLPGLRHNERGIGGVGGLGVAEMRK